MEASQITPGRCVRNFAAVALLLASSLASAATLVPGRGIYVFSGNVTVSHGVGSVYALFNCTLDAKTMFDIDPVGTGIEMVFLDATLTACSSGAALTTVMPWYASAIGVPPPFPGAVPQGGFPVIPGPPALGVPVQINNFDVVTPYGACGAGNIAATYDNNGAGVASSFNFAGPAFGVCFITGTISAVLTAGGFTGNAADIDAFR